MNPAIDAAAGSRLMRTPNTFAGHPAERFELERVGDHR
jgi:hypothetical protein